jgi:hypothetical protein
LYARAKHRRRVAFQFDFQDALVGRHDDGVDQAPERLSDISLAFVRRDFIVEQQVQQCLDPGADPLDPRFADDRQARRSIRSWFISA